MYVCVEGVQCTKNGPVLFRMIYTPLPQNDAVLLQPLHKIQYPPNVTRNLSYTQNVKNDMFSTLSPQDGVVLPHPSHKMVQLDCPLTLSLSLLHPNTRTYMHTCTHANCLHMHKSTHSLRTCSPSSDNAPLISRLYT